MSSKNDDDSSAAAFLMAGAAMVAIALFAVLAFAALIMTVLCFIAWNRQISIGDWELNPDEARAFIFRGIIGAILAPAFIGFCDIVFELQANWSYWPYFVGVGYVLASMGVYIITEADDTTGSNPVDITPPRIPTAPPKGLPRPDAPPFRYASWDDEEETRR